MFSDTPPATGEAAGFGHLPIPLATRAASRTTETRARDSLVRVFPAPSMEPRRTRSAVIIIPEDCSFLSRPVGVASYMWPLVSDSDKWKMNGVPWKCLIKEGMHAGNRSVVLVNEAFVRSQQEVDDLKGHLDAQGRETGKFQHLLRVKGDELNRAVTLSNLQPELNAAKAENLRLRNELAEMVEKNRLLEADKVGLSQDNDCFSSRLGELEATISQLRGELDLVKSDAVSMAERHQLLESESAKYKERMGVFERKAEDRAQICDELKIELEETAEANDLLKAELESATQIQRVFDEERDELVAKLAQAEADLAETLRSVEAAEAHTTIAVEYERWKSRRVTLEQAGHGFADLPTLILEAKKGRGRSQESPRY
ncbi:uncharacterized protein LOC132609049 [Lycium barbarum]|uniref:uncharacterized protein LOC132609049 n=1 Tax=Lycium barbarum TaxID=112863 RepID=UPI00293E3138|nr:uncharacterized protein LOC132609049 [Lycium barbarum]XP_060178858.1 uncharacterized protein LOC132609049 [Lycium barbarum]XP_060178859.1 uncharacterized protein LOC132609049 [Lycium barbarum]